MPAPAQFADSDLPTVDALVDEKRRQAEARLQQDTTPSAPAQETRTTAVDENGEVPQIDKSPEQLEEEADQQGAFNPETGEINWDCPCLGGMAHGPCGEEFKAAFSCFIYSTEEPKGMDCIDKFQYGLRGQFAQHYITDIS
jgi:mitochondrial intermembrane space import and assembly protein 40